MFKLFEHVMIKQLIIILTLMIYILLFSIFIPASETFRFCLTKIIRHHLSFVEGLIFVFKNTICMFQFSLILYVMTIEIDILIRDVRHTYFKWM